MSLDDKSTSSHLMRYGKTAGTAASLIARIAGEKYFGVKDGRDIHALEIMEALASLRGPMMKIGQILATIPEAVPAEYAAELQKLQSNAPPMGQAFVRRRMKNELGDNWENKFASFDMNPAAAASLGQVHRAKGIDGRELACKLQYPNMSSAVESDLGQLGLLMGIFEKYDKTINTEQIKEELTTRFREELDYRLESRNCRIFSRILGSYDFVNIPEVFDQVSTSRLLTSSWLQGKSFMESMQENQEVKNSLAYNLFRSWYKPFYNFGVIHGDPHPGNYTYRDDLSINLLDFGCIRIFPPQFAGGVIDLYRSLQNNDIELAVHAYETWGFSGLGNEQLEALNMWARFLYDPLLDDRIRVIGKAEGGVYGREIAIEVHKKLRKSGTVKIPREFVFMDRAALGLGSVFIRLQAELNWHNAFNELIENFSVKRIEKNQKGLNQIKVIDI